MKVTFTVPIRPSDLRCTRVPASGNEVSLIGSVRALTPSSHSSSGTSRSAAPNDRSVFVALAAPLNVLTNPSHDRIFAKAIRAASAEVPNADIVPCAPEYGWAIDLHRFRKLPFGHSLINQCSLTFRFPHSGQRLTHGKVLRPPFGSCNIFSITLPKYLEQEKHRHTSPARQPGGEGGTVRGEEGEGGSGNVGNLASEYETQLTRSV